MHGRTARREGRTLNNVAPVPTFLGIGPGKSGTTWMYRVLRSHPDVFMSATKETLYFTEAYGRGREWYLSFFEGAESYSASGEISNTYIFSEAAPGRIVDFRAEMKLITCLRHPVDRAFSHYLWLVRNGEMQGSFERALEVRPDLLTRGFYGQHLSRWLDHFPRDQILVLPFWELKEDSRAFARRVFSFVEVEPEFSPEEVEERALGAMRPRSRSLARVAKKSALALRALGLPQVVQRVKESSLVRWLYEPYSRDEYPEIEADTMRRLVDRIRSDVERLSVLTGIDFANRWLDHAGE